MAKEKERIKLGVQLFSLRRYARSLQGLEKCFAFCNKIESRAVQLSAVYQAQPAELMGLSEKYKQEICVTHKSFESITSDCANLCSQHLIYGCKLIGLSKMPSSFSPSNKSQVLAFCETMNKAQEVASSFGVNLAYHNHAFEFRHNIYQTLIDNLDKDIKFILDIYWADYADKDCFALMDKLGDRLAVLHLKDSKTILGRYKLMKTPGAGDFDFAKILSYASTNTACKYALIELDFALAPYKAVEQGMKHLQKIRKD